MDLQNYMSLIRAAGRERDLDRAFSVFESLKGSGSPLDVAVYNCVLDVCVSAGDMDWARKLAAEMRSPGQLDAIAYNTLIKGYCHMGDVKTAKACVDELALATRSGPATSSSFSIMKEALKRVSNPRVVARSLVLG